MEVDRSNIVLVGMPGVGKSTVGVLLAKRSTRSFLDADLVIQSQQGRSLQQILDQEGYCGFREIEEATLLGLEVQHSVIATGGSAVYSPRAMAHLKRSGVVVFLDIDLATLEARLSDFDTRGIARAPGQSLADLYGERQALYAKYGDVEIDCRGRSQEDISTSIMAALKLEELDKG
jgi:shikimate kinase